MTAQPRNSIEICSLFLHDHRARVPNPFGTLPRGERGGNKDMGGAEIILPREECRLNENSGGRGQ